MNRIIIGLVLLSFCSCMNKTPNHDPCAIETADSLRHYLNIIRANPKFAAAYYYRILPVIIKYDSSGKARDRHVYKPNQPVLDSTDRIFVNLLNFLHEKHKVIFIGKYYDGTLVTTISTSYRCHFIYTQGGGITALKRFEGKKIPPAVIFNDSTAVLCNYLAYPYVGDVEE